MDAEVALDGRSVKGYGGPVENLVYVVVGAGPWLAVVVALVVRRG